MSCFPAAVKPKSDWRTVPPPAWVRQSLQRKLCKKIEINGIAIEQTQSDDFSFITAQVHNAAGMSPGEFQQRTTDAYNAIAKQLEPAPAKFPVRFWNYIPSIHEPMDGGRDRYMVFNAGRYAAFCHWYGGADQFSKNIPTASGVGHRGPDLVIHCLAAAKPGIAVENPRQVPPYRYSKRFGPLPPCFSRATVLNDATASRVLVGGTASIVGEESVHLSSLDDQFRETIENLATLVRASAQSIGTAVPASDLLSLFREVRVYFPNVADHSKLEHMLHEQFDRSADVELIEADLCRQELLVEIEGTAELGRPRKLGADS